MTVRTTRILFASIIAVSLALGNAFTAERAARASAVPTPSGVATMETPPPLSATATPKPSGRVIKYSGQLLDYRDGYVFFTTGDGFHVAPQVRIDDAFTGGPTKLVPDTRIFARASFDTGNGAVVELALSDRKLPAEASYDAVKQFAVALSTPYANPDLRPAEGFNGAPVFVTFKVEVPPKTPFGDQIYLATDASGWSATAIRMDRVGALHYQVTRQFPSGTKLYYRYTRGSWQSSDVGQNGIQMKPRLLIVPNSTTYNQGDTVYGWSDQDQFAPDLGSSIP